MSDRRATVERRTRETEINVTVDLDAPGPAEISTGLGFLDHMLDALACHGGLGLVLQCTGDLHVDDHHVVEDCALTLGSAVDEALGDRSGVTRFASAYAPLDEALARTVIDLSGRPCAVVELGLTRDRIGAVAAENLEHFFVSIATTLRAAVHVDVLRGRNDHHRAEAAFKSFALALRDAVALRGPARIPSTKGVL